MLWHILIRAPLFIAVMGCAFVGLLAVVGALFVADMIRLALKGRRSR